jgi:hypothetical protein
MLTDIPACLRRSGNHFVACNYLPYTVLVLRISGHVPAHGAPDSSRQGWRFLTWTAYHPEIPRRPDPGMYQLPESRRPTRAPTSSETGGGEASHGPDVGPHPDLPPPPVHRTCRNACKVVAGLNHPVVLSLKLRSSLRVPWSQTAENALVIPSSATPHNSSWQPRRNLPAH